MNRKAAERKKIEVEFPVSEFDLSGNVTDIIQFLQGIVDQYGSSARISLDVQRGYYDDVSVEVEGRYWRDETDKEFQKRVEKEEQARAEARRWRAKQKALTEANELKELQRLQKKYGSVKTK